MTTPDFVKTFQGLLVTGLFGLLSFILWQGNKLVEGQASIAATVQSIQTTQTRIIGRLDDVSQLATTNHANIEALKEQVAIDRERANHRGPEQPPWK